LADHIGFDDAVAGLNVLRVIGATFALLVIGVVAVATGGWQGWLVGAALFAAAILNVVFNVRASRSRSSGGG